MKPITWIVAAILVLVACGTEEKAGYVESSDEPAPNHTVDCADWNTDAFFEAAEVLDVTRCLQAGADPNARGIFDRTPLYWAASGTAIKALLEAGANPNACDSLGFTPLHVARTAEVVMALLEAGADLNVRDSNRGDTPLHSTASPGYAEAVTALLEAGANPNARNEYGQNSVAFFGASRGRRNSDDTARSGCKPCSANCNR